MACRVNVLTVARSPTVPHLVQPRFNYNYTNCAPGLVMIAVQLLTLLRWPLPVHAAHATAAGGGDHPPDTRGLGKLLRTWPSCFPHGIPSAVCYWMSPCWEPLAAGGDYRLAIAILTVVGTGVSALLGDALQTTGFRRGRHASYSVSGYTWPISCAGAAGGLCAAHFTSWRSVHHFFRPGLEYWGRRSWPQASGPAWPARGPRSLAPPSSRSTHERRRVLAGTPVLRAPDASSLTRLTPHPRWALSTACSLAACTVRPGA